MGLEILTILGVDIVPIIIVAILTEIIKRTLTIKLVKNKFWLDLINTTSPLIISCLITLIFSKLNVRIYIQNVLINWVFSAVAYDIVKPFLKVVKNKEVKDENNNKNI